MKYFRVKYGHSANDFYSIDESEVAKAFKAMVTGGVVVLGGKPLAGNYIITITPDYHRELGLNPEYILKGKDFAILGRKTIKEYERAMEECLRAAQGKSAPLVPSQKNLPRDLKVLSDGMRA